MNRLKKGMRLQSDPTVIYGIAGGQGTLGRSITRADLDQKTPHNTYQIGGLPPTPICNPGRSAIEATLNPPATTDLYFVADGTGGHTFSDTLKEHNAAVDQLAQGRARAQEGCRRPMPAAAPDADPGAARRRSRGAARDQRQRQGRIADGRARRGGRQFPCRSASRSSKRLRRRGNVRRRIACRHAPC